MSRPRWWWVLLAGRGLAVLLILAALAEVTRSTGSELLEDSRQARSDSSALVVVALLAALLALVAAWLRSGVVQRRLRGITTGVEAMARGNFEMPPPYSDGDGFDDLTQALSRVAAHSRERVDMMATDRNNVLAILGVMVEGVVAVDAAGRIVHMNTAAARILGSRVADTEGMRVLEVTRVPEVSAIVSRVLERGAEQKEDLRMVQPPRDRHVGLHGTPLHDAGGKVVGAVLMLHDVTELRWLEAIRRDFVANVSHELKTPITAIRGIVETVLEDREMDGDVQRRFLGRIREQSFRLSSLVTDLLTLSRLEADGVGGELVPTDLRVPIRESVQALAPQAEGKGITVHAELPDEAVRILGEAESLHLVTGNLLDNALKYTPVGGNVWIHLRIDGRDAVVEFRDDGIGIERKHLDRIFQRFYRVDKARSRELGGTGLGLSIVRHVCLAHRGEVSVESRPGEGSTFRVRLPLA